MMKTTLWRSHISAPLVTRFAPSPTGYLHRGHLVSAAFVWGIARVVDAKIILRSEDHDRQRCRSEYEQAMLEDLRWLNLTADAGVQSATSPSAFRQSDHLERYETYALHLTKIGRTYYCDCSRQQIAETRSGDATNELRYSGRCRERGLSPGANCALRVRLDATTEAFDDLWLGPQQQQPADQCGDFVIRDRTGNWTYQFAVTVDDWLERVNLVIRGQDLTASTGRQIALARLLGRTEPIAFLHHPLLTDQSGRKLGKRFFSESLASLRIAGADPKALVSEVLQMVGIGNGMSLADMDLKEVFSRHERT